MKLPLDFFPCRAPVDGRRDVIEAQKPADPIRGDLVSVAIREIVRSDSQSCGDSRYRSHPQNDGAVSDWLEASGIRRGNDFEKLVLLDVGSNELGQRRRLGP